MSKRSYRENFRVEVTPRSPGDFGYASISGLQRTEEEALRTCEDIADQIRRHVDDLPSRGDRGVTVIWDDAGVCEHCGAMWTEDSKTYNGGCCEDDEKGNPERQEDAA